MISTVSTKDLTTSSEIKLTVEMGNPVIRNLRITHTYYQLSVAIAGLVGFENTNWCNFATWASKQAGATIRGDVMPKAVEDIASGHAHFQLKWKGLLGTANELADDVILSDVALRDHVRAIANGVSDWIAKGNLKVFAELAPVFADFVETFKNDKMFDEANLTKFLKQFRPGPSDAEGQDNLVDAFTHLYVAKFEPDVKQKAEHILLANNLTGLHEQTRLQDAIAGALTLPADEIEDLMKGSILSKIPFLKIHDAKFEIEGKATDAASAFREIFHVEATKHMMVLPTPGETLDLGRDVPPRPDGKMFPPELTTIDLNELRAVLSRYDRTADTTRGSGAEDWVSLDDRMNYIVDLFRSRQTVRSMFDPPFSDTQVATFLEGKLPEPPL